jgi:hypothetical protein
MLHRGENDRAGVDHGAVEIEQDNGKTHRLDASRARFVRTAICELASEQRPDQFPRQ